MRSVNITSEERHKLSKQAVILIIDDEKAMRDSCSQVLNKDGYLTETAEDGGGGLEKVSRIRPDDARDGWNGTLGKNRGY